MAADRYKATEPHMGTLVSITLYADSPEQAQTAFTAAFNRIRELDEILSDYKPDSELSRACSLDRPISSELATVLTHAQRVAKETNGAFDITAGALTKLWREARKHKQLPDPAAIQDALQRTGYGKLSIANDKLSCTGEIQLDSGGIAKGYAADEALRRLNNHGISSALVAVSGDIVAGNAPPGQEGWRVQVRDEVVPLANTAVSTSGDEFQFVEIDGIRYSHIVDPRTGMPLRNARPVSVIARTGIEADSLATALSVSGTDKNIIDVR